MKELLELVKELSFVRVGGSAEEKKAAQLIMGEINRIAENAGREDVRGEYMTCLLYTSPSPRDKRQSRMTSSA